MSDDVKKQARRSKPDNFNAHIVPLAHDDGHLPKDGSKEANQLPPDTTMAAALKEAGVIEDDAPPPRKTEELAQDIQNAKRGLKAIAADLQRAQMTLKYRPRDEKAKATVAQLEEMAIDTETEIAQLEDEYNHALKAEQDQVRQNLRRELLRQADDLRQDIVLPGDNLRIRLMYITGAAANLQYQLVAGEDYYLYLLARVQEDDSSTTPDMTIYSTEEKERFYELQRERELMEIHMAYLRTEFDRIAPEMTNETFKPVFLRQTDEQLKNSLAMAREKRFNERREEAERRKEAVKHIHALESSAKIR